MHNCYNLRSPAETMQLYLIPSILVVPKIKTAVGNHQAKGKPTRLYVRKSTRILRSMHRGTSSLCIFLFFTLSHTRYFVLYITELLLRRVKPDFLI